MLVVLVVATEARLITETVVSCRLPLALLSVKKTIYNWCIKDLMMIFMIFLVLLEASSGGIAEEIVVIFAVLGKLNCVVVLGEKSKMMEKTPNFKKKSFDKFMKWEKRWR